MTPEQIVEKTGEVLCTASMAKFGTHIAPNLIFSHDTNMQSIIIETDDEGNELTTYRLNMTLEEIA